MKFLSQNSKVYYRELSPIVPILLLKLTKQLL